MRISTVREDDLAELLPLLKAYCAFYRVAPSDEDLLTLCRALIADPERAGTQLLARQEDGRAVGFATLYWTWSTLSAGRLAVMNDLFVVFEARGAGIGRALIRACRQRAREHGAVWLAWQTETSNVTAQRLYERIGAERQELIDYGLEP
jgi:GNAT superfamily N-acetyltransferase